MVSGKTLWLAPILFVPLACVRRPIVKSSVPPPPAEAPSAQETLITHVQGLWESAGHDGRKTKRLRFEADGQLTFENGFEYLNPGRWTLHPDRQELTLTFPQADDEKLKIFKLYVGQGVQSFDHGRKQVTYHFTLDTWSLMIAGWEYSKLDTPGSTPLAEPTLN